MMIPLYIEAQIPGGDKPFNAGLWYNKFCNRWRHDRVTGLPWSLKTYTRENGNGDRETINPKQDWIKTVSGKTAGNTELLQEAVERQKELVANGSYGECIELITQTALITGMGNPHPVENGFTWHLLLGTPFIPASSVKGLVRDWVENWDVKNKVDIARIFGKQNGQDNTGSVIFLDAIPPEPVRLKTEIMTPHYGAYYESRESENEEENPGLVTPGDWLSPVPIPFLAVAEGQKFQFAVMARRKNKENKDVEKVVGWLIDALKTIGAGGKTAVGYGIMTESFQQSQERQNREAEAEKKYKEEENHKRIKAEGEKAGFKGVALQISVQAKEEEWEEDNGRFYTGAERWIPELKKEGDTESRRKAAGFLAEILNRGKNKGIMKEPEKRSGKKNKLKFKNERARQIAKDLSGILGDK